MQLEVGGLNPDLQALLPKVLSKRYWVLLVDISMSGTSAVSELERLQVIQSILAPDEQKTIILLVQVITGQAEADPQNYGSDYVSAIRWPPPNRSWPLASATLSPNFSHLPPNLKPREIHPRPLGPIQNRRNQLGGMRRKLSHIGTLKVVTCKRKIIGHWKGGVPRPCSLSAIFG